jgi:MFS superfamily sulfate permease-like transporter
VVALLTIVTLLLLTGLFESLPEPALAAVVIAAVIELVDVPALRRLYRVSTARLESIYGRATRVDFICAPGTMLGVLVFDTLPGLVIGIVLSGVVVARVESGLFFANADTVGDRLREMGGADGVRTLVLDATTTPMIDTTAADMLRRCAQELDALGVELFLVDDVGQVRDVLRETGAGAVLKGVFPTIDTATKPRVEHTGDWTSERNRTSRVRRLDREGEVS